MATATAVSKDDRSHSKTPTAPMSGSRDLQRDAFAVALVAGTLMLLISVITRNPADPIAEPIWPIRAFYSPDATFYPPNEVITNACGYWGALVSSMFLDAIGISTALVIAAGGGIATALLSRGGMNAPVLRSLGGTLVIVSASTAAGLSDWQPEGFSAVGSGGYLGAMTSTWLEFHFARPGAWILTVTALAISLLMVTDYALWYAGWVVFRSGAMASRNGLATATSVVPGVRRLSKRSSTDLDSPGPLAGSILPFTPSKNEPTAAPAVDASGQAAATGPRIKLREKTKTSTAESSSAPVAVSSIEKPQEESKPSKAIPPHPLAPENIAPVLIEAQPLEPQPVTREIKVAGEDLSLRGDNAHAAASLKIKLPKKKLELQAEINAAADEFPDDLDGYRLPSIELLEESEDYSIDEREAEINIKAEHLINAFKNFGININVADADTGPVITLYEIALEPGLRLSKVSALADDLAIALRVPSVRIVAPIPGKNTVGIEIPNETRQVVRLRDVMEESAHSTQKMNIPVFLGKDVSGNPLTVDLAKMPHLLIAGRTGTGKSVCLNAIITSILMMCRPDEVRMLMIDPKMVELSGYARLPHLMHPVVTDMKKAEAILAWAVEKMEERYALLAKVGVRHINSYNDLGKEELYRRLEVDENDGATGVPERLPFIVIIADEMADLMMTAGKEVETHIIRLAQKSRAVGIHLILATQKPTVDVITGLIKSNLPARLSFQVASKTDSRVVLDENGADKLLGNGDMLFLWPGTSVMMRGQGTYLSDAEIDRVVEHCSTGEQNFVGELMNLKTVEPEAGPTPVVAGGLKKRDELYESAIEIVVREGRGSVSLLQRCLGIGYGRAARLIDYMAEDGLVGDYNGSQAREVTITMAEWERMQGLETTTTATSGVLDDGSDD